MRKFVQYIFLFIAFACSHKENKTNRLVVNNGLLYQKDSTKPFTGREIGNVQDKKIEYDVVNGMKTGEFKVLYTNGNVQMAGKMVNNMNEGLWKYFYNNSQLESEGNFIDDLPEGKWRWFYNNGALKEQGFYSKGKRNGKWIMYGESGNIAKVLNFTDGVEKNEVKK